jgi:hypothetical protein
MAPAHAVPILQGNSSSSTLDGLTTADTVLGTDKLNTLNVSFNVSSPTNAKHIADLKLTLNHNATGTQSVAYELILDLTTPATTFSDPITLSLAEAGTGTSSSVDISGFAALTEISLPDHIILSDFTFSVADTSPATGSFNNTNDTWTIVGNNGTSTLSIFADVSVPEPSSLALLTAGLAGLWGMRRRKSLMP